MDMQTSNLRVALGYLGYGWRIFPLLGKSPLVQWTAARDGELTAEHVSTWWNKWPEAGVGLALGKCSGVVRLDADGAAGKAHLVTICPSIPATPEFSTPSGGHGWLFKYNGEESDALWRGTGDHEEIRLQSDGAYTVIPPSPHPDFPGYYTWLVEPKACALADLPVQLRDLILSNKAAKAVRVLESQVGGKQPDRALLLEALAFVPDVDSYDRWLQVGMALRSVSEDLLAAWEQWSSKSSKYELGVCQARWHTFNPMGGLTGRSIIHWAKEGGWTPPKSPPQTDVGNSERLVDLHGSAMRHCHPWGKWLIWDERRWRMDDSAAAMRKAVDASKKLLEEARDMFFLAVKEAMETDNGDAQNKKKQANNLFAHAMKSQDVRRIEAALTLAAAQVPVDPNVLDSNPWALNCPNGTLDLRTCELRAHRREDFFTRLCPTEYDPNANCPRWTQFLGEVFAGAPVVDWLQRFLGYCLTGQTTEHMLPIFWGCGANGKSTLLNTVFSVLGDDYTLKAPRDLLVTTRNPSHPTMLASLFGRRFVAAVETADGVRLDEVAVKELTGNDTISCRRLYEDFWTYRPCHKIVLATNHVPEVRGTDYAIWRRLKLVPFLAVFKDNADRMLPDKLAAEGPGILRWMVEGCARWQREGLGEPDEVKAATAGYRSEQDRLQEFISSHFVPQQGCRVRISDATTKYTLWCMQNKEPRMSGQAFGRAMVEKGFQRDDNKKYYLGLAVIES